MLLKMLFGLEEYLCKWLTLQHKGDAQWCSGSEESPTCSYPPSPRLLISLILPQLSSYSSCYPHSLCGSPGLVHNRAQRGLLERWSLRVQTKHWGQEVPAVLNMFPLTPQECSWHPVPSQALKVNTVNYTAEQHIPDLTQGS